MLEKMCSDAKRRRSTVSCVHGMVTSAGKEADMQSFDDAHLL